MLLADSDTEYSMARYSAFLGRRVEVHYRAGDILLPASGMFVADSGRSIFLEQTLVQRGQPKHFRWEIPYQYIVRLEEKPESEDAAGGPVTRPTPQSAVNNLRHVAEQLRSSAKAAAAASVGKPSILPLSNPPKIA